MMAPVVGLSVAGPLRLALTKPCSIRKARCVTVQASSIGMGSTMDPVLAMGSSISCSSFFAPPTSLVPSSSSFSPPSSIICASSASDDAPVEAGDGGGNGDAGGKGKNNNGNNNDDSNNDGDEEDDFLNLEQAEEIAAAKGIELPEDFINAAREGGLRKSVLQQYGIIATGGLVTGFLARTVPAFRDRLIADRLYFFKILAEVAIDSGCATVAELRKRGDEFWDEFEFYLSDLVVGLVLDVVLVTLLAPIAVPGRKKKVAASGLRRWATQLPSGVFEKSSAGRKYSITDRVGCYVARAMEYSLAGMACGVVGQGIASGMMIAKRQYLGAKEGEVKVPPVLETGLVWGLFMAVSANTRYQIVAGLERVVEETIARRVPGVAYFTTTAIRFVNNIIGGEQFIDMARWAGIQ